MKFYFSILCLNFTTSIAKISVLFEKNHNQIWRGVRQKLQLNCIVSLINYKLLQISFILRTELLHLANAKVRLVYLPEYPFGAIRWIFEVYDRRSIVWCFPVSHLVRVVDPSGDSLNTLFLFYIVFQILRIHRMTISRRDTKKETTMIACSREMDKSDKFHRGAHSCSMLVLFVQ